MLVRVKVVNFVDVDVDVGFAVDGLVTGQIVV